MQGKVEISGVNTAKLKTLSNEEMMHLIELAQAGDEQAKQKSWSKEISSWCFRSSSASWAEAKIRTICFRWGALGC